MPHYYSLGSIPHKRHTQFSKPDGSLYSEQLFSTEGFSNNYSLLYHVHPPTTIIKSEEPTDINPTIATSNILKHRSFQGFKIKPVADYLESRKPRPFLVITPSGVESKSGYPIGTLSSLPGVLCLTIAISAYLI